MASVLVIDPYLCLSVCACVACVLLSYRRATHIGGPQCVLGVGDSVGDIGSVVVENLVHYMPVLVHCGALNMLRKSHIPVSLAELTGA